MLRGALAGIVAAAAWAAAEPLVARRVGPPPGYSDVRLLGAMMTEGPRWRAVGIAAHLVNGAVFGVVFARLGGHGWRQGLAAAEIENLALYPGFALIDRIHPDVRSGAWPRLLTSGRVLAYETTVHALFGVVLGALTRR